MPRSESPVSASDRQRTRRVWLAAVGVAGVVIIALALTLLARQRTADSDVLLWLKSEDPSQRQLGAWLAADRRDSAGAEYIAKQLAEDAEAVADVRASYAQTLGSFGSLEHFSLVAELASADSSGVVRQAAWVAAARIDPAAFEELAESYAGGDDVWNEIGLALGYLHAGDVGDVPALLGRAGDGEEAIRLVVSSGLSQELVPLLEVAGRWPLDADVREGEPWPPALVTEIERRCASIDLQDVADRVRLHRAAARRLERDALRMTSARNWIARLLFRF